MCSMMLILCACNVQDGTACVFILSTYTGGRLPDGAAWFSEWLESAATDFRVSKRHLAAMYYAVVAVGCSSYSDTFCLVSAPHFLE